jgi:hypothetical protein
MSMIMSTKYNVIRIIAVMIVIVVAVAVAVADYIKFNNAETLRIAWRTAHHNTSRRRARAPARARENVTQNTKDSHGNQQSGGKLSLVKV